MAKTLSRPPEAALYDDDFPLWAERQAALLRARRFGELDLENLIEEVEDLSRRERDAVESLVETIIEHTLQAIVELFPNFSRMKMLRQWGGIVDVTPDRSPLIGKTPVENLFINCGWGTGGFKATPGSCHVFAHTIAKGEPHPIVAPFTLERFSSGDLVDEHGAAAVAH